MKKQNRALNFNKQATKPARHEQDKLLDKYNANQWQPYEDMQATLETYKQSVRLRSRLVGSATEMRRQLDSIIAQCLLRLVLIEPQALADAHARFNTLSACLQDGRIELPPHAQMMIRAALTIIPFSDPMPVCH